MHKKETKAQEKKPDLDLVLEKVKDFLEHFEEMLLEGDDRFKRACYFGLVFSTRPTYEELKFGTPKLSPLFALNDAYNKGNFELVLPL